MKSPAVALALGLGLAAYVGLAVTSLRQSAATYDEGAHLPAGYTYLVTGDHRLNPEHPPLVKLLAAAPLLLIGHVTFDVGDEAWATGRQWQLGRRFLYRWNDADRLLLWGRLPMVLLGAALCAAVVLYTRARFGVPAALLAGLLAVLSPELLAHGRLVTTDLAMALFYFLTVAAFEALWRRVTWARLWLASAALAAAVASKFSAPVLVPVLAALAIVAVRAREPMTVALGREERTVAAGRARVGPVVLSLAAALLVAWIGLWASYGFTRPISSDPDVRALLLSSTLRDDGGTLVADAALLAERWGLLPEAYVRGFLFTYRHAEARPTFLLGRISDHGFPHFFLVTFALKTPVPLLLLLALAPFLARDGAGWRSAAFLWIPVAGYVLLTQARALNIGHRHLLPLYPFLFVAAGRAAEGASRAWARRSRVPGMALVALAAWYAVGTLRVHPHYLAYFNEIAGGPARGYHCLVDSSLDWGQDLKGLAAWLHAQGIGRVKLSYFGSADPAYYGIDAEMLPSTTSPRPARVTREVRPGDVLAVSATNLQGVYLDPADRVLMSRIRQLSPLGQVGHSIFVFRSDFTWPAP
ncbi:MAG TPA: glycosyltransferase family 39 protein [Vicinamibacteria bacterium]|nr:glycosyltransferase family 39 protein [Vicinamibacteria bacterium]